MLVDADLRRPILHKVFKIDREPGLVDILHSSSFQNFIMEHSTVQKKNLWDDFFVSENTSDLDSMTNEPYNYLIKDQKFDFDSLSNLYAEIDEVVNPISNIEHLSLLTTGLTVENTSEVLGSKIMRTFISLVKKKYDVVIIDSPPVLVVTDTSILGSLVDGVLIVCIAGKTHQRTINRTVELLEKGSTKIWGIVLNQSVEEQIPRSYNKYYRANA